MLLARWNKADGHSGRFNILVVSLVADALRLWPDAALSGQRSAA